MKLFSGKAKIALLSPSRGFTFGAEQFDNSLRCYSIFSFIEVFRSYSVVVAASVISIQCAPPRHYTTSYSRALWLMINFLASPHIPSTPMLHQPTISTFHTSHDISDMNTDGYLGTQENYFSKQTAQYLIRKASSLTKIAVFHTNEDITHAH